jgi:hypothetical protein
MNECLNVRPAMTMNVWWLAANANLCLYDENYKINLQFSRVVWMKNRIPRDSIIHCLTLITALLFGGIGNIHAEIHESIQEITMTFGQFSFFQNSSTIRTIRFTILVLSIAIAKNTFQCSQHICKLETQFDNCSKHISIFTTHLLTRNTIQ